VRCGLVDRVLGESAVGTWLIHRPYTAFSVLKCGVQPSTTPTIRSRRDDNRRTQDVHLDTHHQAADSTVRKPIPVEAPATTAVGV
jgi:hypothetical protein